MNAQTLSDALWAALAALLVAAVALSHQPRPRLERLSVLVRHLEANRVGYVAVLVAWMWVGWHFFAR